jgi:hypothetical protein
VHYIDVWLAFLLYRYRSRESEVDDGKDEYGSKEYVVPPHSLLDVLRRLDVQYVPLSKRKVLVAKLRINESELKEFGERNELAD